MAKRLLDIAVSAIALVVGAPILLIVALAVLLAMGRPVLFRQQRPGLHGRPFEMLKFRTMRDDARLGSDVASDSKRLTRTGRFLRATSLDELPELWNVLRGDMSLVGPRPLLMQYLDRYTAEQARRHDVRPGLTGWAQVNGRNALSWEEKFALDTWYVDNRSFWLDIRIILMTVWSLVRPRGISAEGSATMHEFMGSEATPPTPPGPPGTARRFP
ncbi:sugar transferase [Sphingosinicella sp. YJ22]|uniref:sugar transferase n=1 Tax=Sphingosinicella sp. YJ22 TaxID=1104780 RepID=UPI00140D363D|nr:sugar transferase [Sphingosinicella sp. YJ22]